MNKFMGVIIVFGGIKLVSVPCMVQGTVFLFICLLAVGLGTEHSTPPNCMLLTQQQGAVKSSTAGQAMDMGQAM